MRIAVLKSRLGAQIAHLAGGNAISAGLAAVQLLILARVLGSLQFGILSVVTGYAMFVHRFFDSRSQDAAVRYLARFTASNDVNRARSLCRLTFGTDAAIGTVAFLLLVGTAPWLAPIIVKAPEAVLLVTLGALNNLPRVFVGTSLGVLLTADRYPLISRTQVFAATLQFVMNVGAALIWGTVHSILLAQLVAQSIYAGVVLVQSTRPFGQWWRAPGAPALDRTERREIFGFLFYTNVGELVGGIAKEIDVVILGAARGPVEAGFFRLAKSLAGAAGYILGPLSTVAYRRLSDVAGRLGEAAVPSEAMRLQARLGLPLVGILLALAPFALVIPTVVGAEYTPAVVSTIWLLASQIPVAMSFTLSLLMLVWGRVRARFMFRTLVTVLTVVAYVIVAPTYGHTGVAIVAVASQVVAFGLLIGWWVARGRRAEAAMTRTASPPEALFTRFGRGVREMFHGVGSVRG